jgi:hypothetical protein
MSLKTKEHDGDLRRQLCACSHNGVQLCMGYVQAGKKYLHLFLLPDSTRSFI